MSKKDASGPNLLHAINAGYVLEDGSFGILELQFEQGDNIHDLRFAADMEICQP